MQDGVPKDETTLEKRKEKDNEERLPNAVVLISKR